MEPFFANLTLPPLSQGNSLPIANFVQFTKMFSQFLSQFSFRGPNKVDYVDTNIPIEIRKMSFRVSVA